MIKEPEIFVDHVLECIERIEQYIGQVTKDEFSRSVQLQDAVIRRIEIIGEAVKNIPSKIKDRYQDIAWKELAGMRDILIHQYLGVDLDLTWRAATKEVARLKKEMSKVKEDLDLKRE